MTDGKPTAEDKPKDWRGVATSKGDPVPEYRWKSDSKETVPLHTRRANVKRRIRITGLIALMTAISAAFLVELLFSTPRTPMIIIAPADYEWPFQPLSWIQEDIDGFRTLDRETLDVHAIDSGWKTKDQGLRQLDSQLQNIIRQAHRPQAIVLYLRMHSAVDGVGTPCLVPPGASPFNSDSWLPVKDVLERFRQQNVPDSIPKLVILDCQNVLVSWKQGIVFNTFATRLPEAVSNAEIPNLTVFNAAGPSEIAATSVELRHGVFGHFLRLGLAGAADSVAESGNGDRLVSMRELHRYLTAHVSEWSETTRGWAQHPQLIPVEPLDFDVATVFNARAAKKNESTSRLAANTASVISATEMNQLWKALEESQASNPVRYHPLEWTDLEHRICWLEAASESGTAYARSARRVYHDLQQRLELTESPPGNVRPPQAFPHRWAKLANSPIHSTSIGRMNSLPLNDFFRDADSASADNFHSIIAEFKKSPSTATLNSVLHALSGNTDYSHLEIPRLLRLWQQYDVTRFWSNGSLLPLVLELHEQSELASVPRDERALDWIRPFIDAADAHRRKVEDRVFLGGELPRSEISEAQRLYRQASQIAVEVARAYATRDRLDHELPFLAEFLARPPLDGHATSLSFARAKNLLFDLLSKLQSLEDALSRPAAMTESESVQLPFPLLVSNIETQLKQLTDHLAGEYERLVRSEETQPEVWNDIDDLLSIPLLPPRNEVLELSPSQQRGLLREKRGQLGRKLAERASASPVAPPQTAPSKDHPLPQSSEPNPGSKKKPGSLRMGEFLDELLIAVPESLPLAIARREPGNSLQDDTHAPSSELGRHDVETIAESHGRRFRLFMNSLSEIVQSDTERQMMSTDQNLFQNSLCERALRASASIGPVKLKIAPVAIRRSDDLQRLLLWHSRRSLDDFWGSGSPEEPPFFDTAASTLLRTAAVIGKPTTRTQAETLDLNVRLKRYRTAASEGLSTVSDNLLVADSSDPIVAKVAVYQKIREDSIFPEGQGAVFVQNHAGERLGEIRSLEIPWAVSGNPNATAAQFDITLIGVDPHAESLNLKAVTAFRGHDFPGDLIVNSISGIMVDYVPNADRESRIAIRGLKLRKLSIVFVLDCSNSMGQELPLETERRRGSRLRIAKLALESMLDKLAEDERHRVGVICFGHRIGWNLTQAGQLLRQTEYPAPIPDQTRPYDDVETILPLGRFNASFAAMVNERLASVKPWGESPFYLALIQALKLFENDEVDSDKCVVAITDGMNYQFNPPAASRKSIVDVLAAWRDHQVRIHIVGLGIAPEQAAVVQREFGELTRQTNGSYVSAQEARTLVESLAALQRISQFHVRGTSGAEETAEIGRPITVNTNPERQNEFEVTLGPASEIVSLQGGESLELLPTRDGRRLEVPAYEVGQPQFERLVKDDKQSSATDLVAGFHRPFRRGQQVTFEISIQHNQRHFVRRPTEAWIEISPIVRSGLSTPPVYVLYDGNYLPETSVPVVRWTLNDWPVDASQAKIRVWFKFDESKATSIVSLKDALDSTRNPDFTLDGVTGVNTRIRVRRNGTLQISVVERHSIDSAGVGTLKVGLSSSITPDRVRHRFDAANRIATHLFEFSRPVESVLNDGEILFTTRSSAQLGSLRTIDAVIVDVAVSRDVHD